MKLLNCGDLIDALAVTSPKGIDKTTKLPDENGLFSYTIFGRTNIDRSTKMGKILLNKTLIHPVVFDILKKRYRNIIHHILAGKPWVINSENKIELYEEGEYEKKTSNQPYYGLSALQEYNNFYLVFKDANNPVGEMVRKYGNDVIINCIPVIPPNLRSEEYGHNPINYLYSSIISSNNTLEKLGIEINNFHDKKLASFSNGLQKLLDSLFETIISQIKGKEGIIRKNILGKREDFTARAVAVGDPKIPINHIGVPLRIAVKIFEPFILRCLIKDKLINLDNALEILKNLYYKEYNDLDDLYRQEYVPLVEKETNGRYVIVKRDPVIHRLGISSMKVIIVYDNCFHVNPLQTSGFNLDFDGDTLTVLSPITVEAIEELPKMNNPYHSANIRIKDEYTKDYVYTARIITYIPETLNKDEHPKLLEYWSKKIIFNNIETTKGREALFLCLPENCQTKEIYLHAFTSKKAYLDPNNIVLKLLEKIPIESVTYYMNNTVKLLSEIISIASESITLEELILSEELNQKVSKELEQNKIDEPHKINKFLEEKNKEVLHILAKDSNIKKSILMEAPKKEQLKQLMLMKGFISNVSEKPILVKENIASGLSENNFFISGYAARSGIVHRVVKTPEPGVLERTLSFALSNIVLDPTIEDCKTSRQIKMKITEELFNRILGRYINIDGNLYIVTRDIFEKINNTTVNLRSPIYCKTPKICLTCYGSQWKIWNTKEIGFLAATSIGERMYQEMMKVFHVGGTVKVERRNPISVTTEIFNISRSKLEELFYFEHNNLYNKKPISLHVSREYYKIPSKMDPGDELMVSDVIANVHDENNRELFEIFFSGDGIIFIPNDYYIKEGIAVLNYPEKSIIFHALPSEATIDRNISKFKSIVLFGKKLHLTNPDDIILFLYNSVKNLGNVALIHYEVLLSQLLRNKITPEEPARLVEPYNPILYGAKEVINLESTLLAAAYSNFKQSLIKGLISEKPSFHERRSKYMDILNV